MYSRNRSTDESGRLVQARGLSYFVGMLHRVALKTATCEYHGRSSKQTDLAKYFFNGQICGRTSTSM